MESLSQCNFDRPTCPGEKVLANLLRRAWWAERVKDTWRRGSAEAAAQPRLARTARALRSPAAMGRDADDVWPLAEGSMAKWQKTLRGRVSARCARCHAGIHGGPEQATSQRGCHFRARAEVGKLRSRMRWLDDTAGMTLLGKDIEELSARIERTKPAQRFPLG